MVVTNLRVDLEHCDIYGVADSQRTYGQFFDRARGDLELQIYHKLGRMKLFVVSAVYNYRGVLGVGAEVTVKSGFNPCRNDGLQLSSVYEISFRGEIIASAGLVHIIFDNLTVVRPTKTLIEAVNSNVFESK